MRRLSFIIYSLLFIISGSFAQEQVITETMVSGEYTYVTHYLYDAQARPFLLITEGLSQQLYTYNDAGQIVRQDYTDLTGEGSSPSYVYSYNEAGLVATEEEFFGERSNGITTYTYDEHGNRTSIITSSGLPIPWKNFYDETGHLIRQEVWSPMGGDQPLQATVFSYDNELVIKEEHYSNGELVSTTLQTYNEAGQLVKTVTVSAPTEDNPEGEVTSTTTYEYADIDVSFAPYNVQAVAGDGNTIVVTWEGTANAVVVDGKYYAVTGNTFTTPVLLDGTYTVYAINNGNATTAEPLDIADNTKVGVSDVRLDGDITITFAIEQDRDGNDKEVTYYNLPVAWTLPDGAKPIGYRIYYNSTYYVDVEDGTLRSFVIPAKNITIWSMSAMGQVTLDFVVRVIAIYETGEMEPVNTLPLDTEAILALAAHMQATQAALETTEVYTLTGIRLPSHNNLRPGTYVFRRGNVTRTVMTR